MSKRQPYKDLPGLYAATNDDVMWENWELQELKLKNNKLGLSAFLNKHFPYPEVPKTDEKL